MRLAQSRLRSAHIRIGAERLLNQPIQVRRAKYGPPLVRDVHAGDKALRRAVSALGRGALAMRGAAIVCRIGRRGPFEIRTHRASRHGNAERNGDEVLESHRPHRAWPCRCSAQCSMT